MKNWTALVAMSVVAGFATSAVADEQHDQDKGRQQRTFRAKMVSLSEVPSVSSPASGQFYAVVNKDGTSFTYWLSYSGMSENVSQSHIHLGQHHTNGGISVWLCQGALAAPAAVAAQTPVCAPRETTTPITATIDATDVIGPAGQGISASEFAELLAAIRAGAAYANVHSGAAGPPVVGFPGGEIRGQIN